METTESPESTVNREEKEEKKGAGFFANFLNKLGLGGAAGEGAGVGVGSSTIGAAGGGGFAGGGILATKAGIVALIVAGTTIAAGIGVVGRSALSGKPGGVTDGIYSLFPGKSGATAAGPAAGASGTVDGASSSLDYMSQAAKNDPMMQEKAASSENAANSASADATAPGQVAAPDNSNAPANVGSARPGGPKLAKMASFSGSSGGSGGGMSSRAPDAGTQRGMDSGRGRLVAMNRGMSSSGTGGRALVGSRGLRAGDQARSALMDGNRANSSRSPSMASAGRTFDGAPAAGGMQSSAGGPMDSGTVGNGSRDRFSPNKTLDTKELPKPKPVEKEQDATPYKTQMWIAIGAIVVSMLSLALLSGLKEKAESTALRERILSPEPATATEAIAEYNGIISMAKVLSGIATAAGALATAMGIMIMTGFGQTLQGGLLAGIGGLMTLQAGMKFMSIMKLDPLKPGDTQEATESALKSLTSKFGEAIKSSFFGGGL